MTLSQRRELLSSLQDEEYRHEFVSEHVGVGLAFQIQRLRQKQNWTQEELARHTNKTQETISRWENPDYGRFSLSTLKEVAAAFDVALLVRFVSFGDLADWTIGLTPQRLAPQAFDEEWRQPALQGLRIVPRFDISDTTDSMAVEPPVATHAPDTTAVPGGELAHAFA